jgi:hypothetical protein
MDRQIPEAPLSAGPPPLFDVTAFSQWVTDVFTEEYDDEILDKLASMDAGDDMAKMKLLLSEECAARRSRLDGAAVSKSYSAEDEGSASKDVLMICFGGENDCFGGNGATEGVTHTAFLKLCKKANVKYAIFVRDATHCWYQRGLKAGIDPNQGFDSVIDELGKEIDLIKPREVVCMGSSMGGYAAIRAGLVLKASAIIAFSPQVLLGTADRASAMILPMPTLDPYLLKVHLAAELEGFRVKTLIQCVEQCPGYDTTIQVHMGELDAHCGREIEMLRVCAARRGAGQKGGSGVKVSVRVHQTMDPVGEMKQTGELLTLLKGYGRAKPKAASARAATAPRSARWLSAAGRQEAALAAGIAESARGPVAKPSDGRGFDASLDARALPGENELQFKALVAMWKKIEAEDLPGYFFWQKAAFELVHRNLMKIVAIFFEYCKKSAAPGTAGKGGADNFNMSQREWVSMCKAGAVPVSIGEINDAHRRCDRASKEDKEAAKTVGKGPARSDKALDCAEFLEALLRLSVKLLATSASGRKALKAGNGGEGFRRLLEKYLLPLAEVDSMAIMRATMASPEVLAVLDAMKEPLEKRFNAMAKRKTKILDPKKKPKGDGTKPEAVEVAQVSVENFIKDIEMAKLFIDKKIMVDNPISGEKMIECNVELSRVDGERAFIESQDGAEAMLAMITGDEKLMESSASMVFEEYGGAVAFCGLNMFRNVPELPPAEKVEAFARMLCNIGNKAHALDFIVEERVFEAVKYSLTKSLKRFNPDADLSADEKADEKLTNPDFVATWKRMILDDCHGWPLWEKDVFIIFAKYFEELGSIFSYYAKSGGTGTSADSAFKLQQAEVTNFALDCELTTKDFMMTRIHSLMEVSDQQDATIEEIGGAGGAAHRGGGGLEVRKGGDNSLEFHEFLELLMRVSFQRLNPKYGSVGNRDCSHGKYPECLEKMLAEKVMPKAKRDKLREVLEKLKVDPEVQKHFKKYEYIKEVIVNRNMFGTGGTSDPDRGLKKMFEAKAFETRSGIQKFGVVTLTLQTLTDWFGPDFDGTGKGRGLFKDIVVNPTPQVSGTVERPRHSNLSNLDLKGVFSTAQRTGESTGNSGVDYEEFLHVLGLCGHIKYEEIEEMSLADRVEGIIQNFLQDEDEHRVISKYCCPPLPRYDCETAKINDGEDKKLFARVKQVWSQMDLKHVYGFPLWEEGVFKLFHDNFEQLSSIFDYYAKSGTAGSSSSGALLTMQQTELQTLALDTGMTTDKFSMTRVINIFKRADQVDGTIKESKVNKNVLEGENAKAGDKGLELHEFFEAVVMLAFQRANPKWGEVGSNNKAFSIKADGSVRVEKAAKEEYILLPGCLETLFKDVLLKKAKTDTLAKIKKIMETDAACQAVFKEHRAYFKEAFSKRAVDSIEGGKQETWTLEAMMEDFLDRKLLNDQIIHPTPAVSGTTPPTVHVNLSWLDAKGAFATCQARQFEKMSKTTKSTSDTSMTFDEFYMCVALCGHIKYEEIEQMTVAQRMEGIFYNYRLFTEGEAAAGKHSKGVEHKHGRKDEHAWVSLCLYPPLPRYEPPAGTDPSYLACWKQMDLSHVIGYPMWEEGVFMLFGKYFPELSSIFQQYAKSGAAGSGSAISALTMQKTELTNLALDCQLANETFSMARVINIFERADQADDTMYRDETTGIVKGETAKGGDRGLVLHEFFECLVMMAVYRQNPKYGTVGNTTSKDGGDVLVHPLPGCLETLLTKSILTKAKTDQLTKTLKRIQKEPEVRAVINQYKAELKKAFEGASNKEFAATKAATMTLEKFIEQCNKRHVAKDIIVKPTPAISGAFVPDVHSNLSQLDIRGAFVTGQSTGGAAGGVGGQSSGSVVIDFEEFLCILGLCGHIKYEEIEKMDLATRVKSIYLNYLVKADEQKVISDCLYPPPPRFDPKSVQLPQKLASRILDTWGKMDLSHVFGFPIFEEVVFKGIAGSYEELTSIFTYYAKSGTAGATSADQAMTIQATELGNLALDLGILTESFNMTRIVNIYRRADQVDDTIKKSASDHRVEIGEDAKGGDRGLEFHEFLESMVMLGFSLANPKYGEVGNNFAADVDAGTAFMTLLKNFLLKKAKTDGLALVKAEIIASAECQEIFKAYRAKLRKEFDHMGKSGPMKVAGKLVINMEMFCDDCGQMNDSSAKHSHQLVKNITVTPTPAVRGMKMPEYHSNLSQLDIKGCFVTAQSVSITSGDMKGMDDAKETVDYDEWCICLGLCGYVKYEEIEEMSLAQRVAGIIANYLHEKDEHAVITEAVVAPVLRFDPKYSAPSGGQPIDEYEQALTTWNKMDLQHLYGFPVWEGAIFELIKANYGELLSIFMLYAKGKDYKSGKGSAAESTMMAQTELTEFAVDCSLATGEFPMTKIIELFERADVVDDAKDGKSKSGQKAGKGDGALELHEFLEALVMISFYRANPKFEEALKKDAKAVPTETFPACFESLLSKQVLVNAKRDEMANQLKIVQKDRAVLNKIRSRREAAEVLFQQLCAAEKTKGPKAPVPKLGIDAFVAAVQDRKLACDLVVKPVPAVAGEAVEDVHVCLTWQDAKQCFVTVQAGDADTETVYFDEFMMVLSLCGLIKYAEVKEKPGAGKPGIDNAGRCLGAIDNFLGTRNEVVVVSNALYPPIERYNPAASGASEAFLGTWAKMDLSHLAGFPLWEEGVFLTLYGSFDELISIFSQYAKSGSGNAKAAKDQELTMQQTELTDLALDCSLATDKFPMSRVIELFERADMADAKPGEAPKPGDGALELFEFLEAVVMLALFRANPSMTLAGGATKVDVPLPDCLVTMLKENLLLNAKRDQLAAVKAQLKQDGVQDAMQRRRDGLKRVFDKLCKSEKQKPGKGGPTLSMDVFTQDLFERGIARDVEITPTSPVKGKKLDPVVTKLSVIDAKGAFVTSQKVEKENTATTINFDEFMVCLALCGSIKYANVEKMSLAQKVDSLYTNYLGETDEQKCIDLCYPPPPRFNPAVKRNTGGPVPSATFMDTWKKMDLSHLFGFPEFEEGVFALLEKSFGELSSIFSQYSKSGTAGSASATSLQTMQKTEFFNFAMDCGVVSNHEQGFNATRVTNIFTRADQVDDTLKATKVKTLGVNKDAKAGDGSDKANVNTLQRAADRIQEVEITVMKGDFAQAGDHGLKLEEFLEAVVAMSLYYSNPDFGELGHNFSVDKPLPGCLESVLNGYILKNAKRDKLALIKASLETDRDCQMIMPGIRKALEKDFIETTKVGVRMVFGKQVMSMDMFQKQLQERRCIQDLMIKPTPKVKGQVFPVQKCNFSWLDAKGAFTTAQRGDGGEEGNESIDFDEFVIALALCGSIKYENIAEMTLATRFSGMVQNYLNEADEQFIVSEAVVPPPPRYDTSKAKPLKDQAEAEHKALLKVWSQMDLSHVFGFPLWEEELFGVFQRAYPELKSIFAQYAKSGSAGSGSALSAMTMQQTELTDLALDCELATEQFKMARINNIFMRADQKDDTFEVNKADSRAGSIKGKTAEKGNQALTMPEFFECLVMIAFARAQPEFGDVGKSSEAYVKEPLPGCLESMLTRNILVKAKRDVLMKYKKMVDKDPECVEALRVRKAALKLQFEAASQRDATTMTGTKDQFGNAGGEEDGSSSLLGIEMFNTDIAENPNTHLPRMCCEDLTIKPTPAITGDVVVPIKSNLSWLDVKGAFVTCQNDSDGFVTFEEWCSALALCGVIKYENVPDDKMTLGQKVAGMYDNYLQTRDAHSVVTEVLQPPAPRFTPTASSADKSFLAVWSKMNLTHVFYFPTWEKEVFMLLAKAHDELKIIFSGYAKSGTAGSSTATALFTMQKTELTNFALDCGISSSNDTEFPMVRVTGIYERGDQVDDTQVASKADKRVKVGKGAEAGDHGLEIHEFYEVLVMLAFAKANPKFGQLGQNTVDKVANPLPGCLETLLTKNILTKAKRDEMPALIKKIKEDPECQKLFKAHRAELANKFVLIAGKGEQGGKLSAASSKNIDGLSMKMDDFYDAMYDSKVVSDTTVAPRPPVVGQPMKKYAMGLSSIDAKSAFAAAQDGSEKQKLAVGDARQFVDFEEFMVALAVCGFIKYRAAIEDGMKLSQCVGGAINQLMERKSEQDVLTDALFPEPPRNKFFEKANPAVTGGPQLHAQFVNCWKEMVITDIVGFPVWEEAVFKLLQPNFEEIYGIFANYAQSITGGQLQSTAWQAVTLQENELASFCRDSGLITAEFSIARVQSLYKDLCNNSPKLKEGLDLPAFMALLLHISLHRANPKLAGSGGIGEGVKDPLPGCFEAALTKNILGKAKKNRIVKIKTELMALDLSGPFKNTRSALKKEFEKIEKKREKKALMFFGTVTLTRPTIVGEFKDRNLVVIKKANPRPPTTGAPPAEVEVGLSALDVESAFILCQNGEHAADGGNDSIDFEEFLLLLAMCGMLKYADVASMDRNAKIEGIAKEFLGTSSDSDIVASAGGPVERYKPPKGGRLAAHWSKMDLSRVNGFPEWEEEVYGLLEAAYDDLEAIFLYYAGADKNMQQTELVDFVADCGLAAPHYGLPKIVKLFDEVNKQTGATDSDLELHEFFQLIVQLAYAINGGGTAGGATAPVALRIMIESNLSRMSRKAKLAELLAPLKADADVQAALGTAPAPPSPLSEASFIQQLQGKKLVRGAIVGDLRCDLTWLDASAAFLCSGGDYKMALALCGAVKYAKVAKMTDAQRVAGFLANLAGTSDEHKVVAAA